MQRLRKRQRTLNQITQKSWRKELKHLKIHTHTHKHINTYEELCYICTYESISYTLRTHTRSSNHATIAFLKISRCRRHRRRPKKNCKQHQQQLAICAVNTKSIFTRSPTNKQTMNQPTSPSANQPTDFFCFEVKTKNVKFAARLFSMLRNFSHIA